ncbi:MAG: hypothetical protein RLZZ283_207 [Candidatus Parcubacteria bacterium]|jgi:hypothetical protein
MNMARRFALPPNVISVARGRELVRLNVKRGDIVKYVRDYEVDAVHPNGDLSLSRYTTTGKLEAIVVPVTALDKDWIRRR